MTLARPTGRWALVGAVALLALSVAGCSSSSTGSGGDTGFVSGDGTLTVLPVSQRQELPALSGPKLGGGTLDVADYKGKVVVLNIWASWCGPCRSEVPEIQKVQNSFDKRGVQFIGMDTRDTNTAAPLAFVDRFDITYPSLYDPDARLQLLLHDTLPPQAIPSTIVIDREGRVAARVIGPLDESLLRPLVEDVVGEGATSTPTPSAKAKA